MFVCKKFVYVLNKIKNSFIILNRPETAKKNYALESYKLSVYILYCIIYVSANSRFTCTWNLNSATVVIRCHVSNREFYCREQFDESLFVFACFALLLYPNIPTEHVHCTVFECGYWKSVSFYFVLFSLVFFSRTLEFIFYDTIIAFLYFIIPFSMEEYSVLLWAFILHFLLSFIIVIRLRISSQRPNVMVSTG